MIYTANCIYELQRMIYWLYIYALGKYGVYTGAGMNYILVFISYRVCVMSYYKVMSYGVLVVGMTRMFLSYGLLGMTHLFISYVVCSMYCTDENE